MRFKQFKYPSDAGFSLLGAMGALIIMAIMIPILNAMWQTGVNAIRKRAVADHFNMVQKAAHNYAKQYHTTLLPQVTVNSGPTVTIADLKTAKVLPDRVQATNAWGQGYQIAARKDATTGLLTMVVLTTGGRGHTNTHPEFANVMVPETAALARAGYVSAGTVGTSGTLYGAYGSWQIALASLGLTGTPGHLGSITSLTSDDLAQDFLYRVAVPGQPELNAMQTSLDMTSHSINNVGSLAFTPQQYAPGFCTAPEDEGRTFLDKDKGLYLCRDGKIVVINDSGNSLMMQDAQLAHHGQLIDKPICPEGANLHPEIFVAPSIISLGAESPHIASMQAWATNYSVDQWQVQLRLLSKKEEWVYPTPDYGRVVVMTTCARN